MMEFLSSKLESKLVSWIRAGETIILDARLQGATGASHASRNCCGLAILTSNYNNNHNKTTSFKTLARIYEATLWVT